MSFLSAGNTSSSVFSVLGKTEVGCQTFQVGECQTGLMESDRNFRFEVLLTASRLCGLAFCIDSFPNIDDS